MADEVVWVVTGANRGLGLEFTRQLLLGSANCVIATMRKVHTAEEEPINMLRRNVGNARLLLIELDQSKEESVRAAAEHVKALKPGGVNYLLNNAGATPKSFRRLLPEGSKMRYVIV